jgi:hypothetical protein
MKTATLLLALVASANAALISPGASYNLDYTCTTSPSTDLSGHITTIKSQLSGGDFNGAYTTYDGPVKTLVDAVTSSAILTLFNAQNADVGATFSAQVTRYLSEVKVRLMNKP